MLQLIFALILRSIKNRLSKQKIETDLDLKVYKMQMKTLGKLKLVVILYFTSSLILIMFDLFGFLKISGERNDCNINVFTGSFEALNAVNWIITRSAASISSSLTFIYLFYKSTSKSKLYHQMLNQD